MTLDSSSDIARASTAAFAQHNREEIEGDWENHINTKCQGDLNGSLENEVEIILSSGGKIATQPPVYFKALLYVL